MLNFSGKHICKKEHPSIYESMYYVWGRGDQAAPFDIRKAKTEHSYTQQAFSSSSY